MRLRETQVQRSCDNSLFLHRLGQAHFGRDRESLRNQTRRHDTVSIHNAPCIRVHNENWMISGVQENRVRGFRANAVQAEQFNAQLYGWLENIFSREPAYF